MRLGLRNVSRETAEQLFHRATKITYSTVQDFDATVERSLSSQEQEIRAFLQHIQKLSYFGPPAPEVRLTISAEVIDKRQKSTGPLHVIAPRYIDLP